jgi:hypothetical protein
MEKILTPYGGRLVFTMPGENKLVVDLKDKEKTRHKKKMVTGMILENSNNIGKHGRINIMGA